MSNLTKLTIEEAKLVVSVLMNCPRLERYYRYFVLRANLLLNENDMRHVSNDKTLT